jgi:hypothetical protein
MMAALNLTSSLRKQGPITTGLRGYERSLPPYCNETTRRMGPCFRRDDGLRWDRALHTLPSSPGLTGRSSTPRLLGSTARPLEYWIPAFAGMTSCGRNNERSLATTRRMGPCFRRDDGLTQSRALHIAPSSPGLTGRSSTPRRLGRHSGARVSATRNLAAARFYTTSRFRIGPRCGPSGMTGEHKC